jgi:peptidoglycan/LPS O-acetylase OafA/YrhL
MIVLHHLAFYGPLSVRAERIVPELSEGLVQYGRFAVQVFFVLGGYVTARHLDREWPNRLGKVLESLVDRYRRIALPYLAALLFALVANWLARQWMVDEAISKPATVEQLLAHVLLLQDLLGHEPLTAGIWYLAIDLQLVTLSVVVSWIVSLSFGQVRGIWLSRYGLLALGVLSAFLFNRAPTLDKTALYFYASYAFGLAVAWIESSKIRVWHFALYLVLVLCALGIHFRGRLFVAAVTALALLFALRSTVARRLPNRPTVRILADSSYSLFLIHFPLFLVVNAAAARWLPEGAGWTTVALLAAYAASVFAGLVFHRHVERPLLKLNFPLDRFRRYNSGSKSDTSNLPPEGRAALPSVSQF